MAAENKNVQLPFVLKPYWGSWWAAFLALCLGFVPTFVLVMLWDKSLLVTRTISILLFLGFVNLMWIFLFYLSLGKINCDENAMTIKVFGLPFSKIHWANIRKVVLSESADVQRSQPRYLIYHDGAFLGLPIWMNDYMFRREDLETFLSLLRQKTTHVKFSGFSGKI